MKNNIFQPFSQATCDVLKLLMDLNAQAGNPKTIQQLNSDEDKVNVIIGVTGDLDGKVLYRFPKETSLEMVKTMSGMEIEEIDDFVTSALGEVANIISGNALICLSDQQLCCDIRPPQIAVNCKPESLINNEEPIVATDVATPIGNIELNIQVREAK